MAGEDEEKLRVEKYSLTIIPNPLQPILPPELIMSLGNFPEEAEFLTFSVTANTIDLYYMVDLASKRVTKRFLFLAPSEITKRELDGFIARAVFTLGERFVFSLEQ